MVKTRQWSDDYDGFPMRGPEANDEAAKRAWEKIVEMCKDIKVGPIKITTLPARQSAEFMVHRLLPEASPGIEPPFTTKYQRVMNMSHSISPNAKPGDCILCDAERAKLAARAEQYHAEVRSMALRHYEEIQALADKYGFPKGDVDDTDDTGDVYDDVDDAILHLLGSVDYPDQGAKWGKAFITGIPVPEEPDFEPIAAHPIDDDFKALAEMNYKTICSAFALPTGVLTPEIIEEGSKRMRENYGTPTPIYDAEVVEKVTHKEECCGRIGGGHHRDCPTEQYRQFRDNELKKNGLKEGPTKVWYTGAPIGETAKAVVAALTSDADACECGAHKTSGAARGSPAHSSWCPWRKA